MKPFLVLSVLCFVAFTPAFGSTIHLPPGGSVTLEDTTVLCQTPTQQSVVYTCGCRFSNGRDLGNVQWTDKDGLDEATIQQKGSRKCFEEKSNSNFGAAFYRAVACRRGI